MEYTFLILILCITSAYGKCHKHCITDSDCTHDHYCKTDAEGCHSECTASKHDVPPPVIGKRCIQLPMFCPQYCMVTVGGCTTCDCSHATGSGSMSPSGSFQNSPFGGALPFGNQMGQFSQQSGQTNPGNMNPFSHGLTGPNSPSGFNPGNPGGALVSGNNVPAQLGGSSGITLDQIIKSTKKPPTTTELPKTTTAFPQTTIPATCAPVRCIAPCNKGVAIGQDGCPKCLCN